MNSLEKFSDSLLDNGFMNGLKAFFQELKIPVDYVSDEPASPESILEEKYKPQNPTHALIKDVYMLGIVNDAVFMGRRTFNKVDQIKNIKEDYEGILIFGVILKSNNPTRGQLAEITRLFNRAFPYMPVVVVFRYDNCLAISNSERIKYKQEWREGEKAGKVTMLKDISITHTHAAHKKILSGLAIDPVKINSYQKLYDFWQTVFSLQALNDQFYADLQDWFYFASQHIKLPFKPTYINEKENIKNFLVRLLARTMFCWFVKEKGLIKTELLELKDFDGTYYPLTKDINDPEFLESNSYYRGILQNIFFYSLNKKEKSSIRDFKWKKYIHREFKIEWFTEIPYLNGGIFDKLDEDNAKESIEDSVMKVPNYLFYGITQKQKVIKGRGTNAHKVTELIEHKGLNGIFKSYKFTLEENTPYEENIALDPELLGLVFENLLAELDPNLEENTIKSIRKLTGSYYTPRKVIQEMVNDSLFLYLKKHIEASQTETLKKLIYRDILENDDNIFCDSIVSAIDQIKVLDPACGSGAFPMGVLHRLVEILKKVDPDNSKWLKLKLKPIDSNYRSEFEKTLKQHLNDYSRKLGIIRDSIYGIDIQPLAVQITKLRFFISLLIDQKVETGITPMPNIETKIMCADSLKNFEPDLFASSALSKLELARIKYYRPDLSFEERKTITEEIISVLDSVFPTFSYQITGKHISGQNKELLRHWFTHASLAAPFFNMDFFYPELKGQGFDIIIGNPPYGGTKMDDEICDALGIQSKDPYGAFIARFLASGNKQTPLKHGGVLAYIVSDTFMTIRSHYLLRKQMMDNYIHKMIRVHPDTFRATVNTAIIICERNVFPKDKLGYTIPFFDSKHICQMIDMTNISIHDNYSRFVELLHTAEGVDFSAESGDLKNLSNSEYAIYYYPQILINNNSNLPFFVASPKLFALLNNCNDTYENIKIGNNLVRARSIFINGKNIRIVKLGEIADVKHGMTTGDNETYIYADKSAKGNYKEVDYNFVLSSAEMESLSQDEWFYGFDKKKFNGKFLVPHDKGGESDSEDGWLPQYYVPSKYFIAWDLKSVKDMMKLIGHRHDNPQYYGRKGLTFSPTGIYAPTFRVNSASVFGHKGSNIFLKKYSVEEALGILNSKIYKYLLKSYLVHGVDATEKPNSENSIPLSINNNLKPLVASLIQKQKQNPRYDYVSYEQIEIDKIIYESYGLSVDDIEEVENWYARRYTKLSLAQKENLLRLGKSCDYLVLYGLKRE